MFLILRFCCATLSACIVILYIPRPAYPLYLVSSDLTWFWYEDPAFKMRVMGGGLWMAVWALLEIRSFRRSGQPTPKLLTHLRYGPIAILILSIAMATAFDVLLIQYSRWQIVRYIHSDAPPTERPSFKLHNNYRSFCVNGMAANEYELYGDTPAAYINAPDAATRARALQASMSVYDWINLPNDGPSIVALKKAATDPDPMVRELAAKLSADLF